jgi:outer membrane protein insertion porin family
VARPELVIKNGHLGLGRLARRACCALLLTLPVALVAQTSQTQKASDLPNTAVPETQGATLSTDQAARVPANTGIENPLPALAVSVWTRQGTPVEAIHFEGVTFSEKDSLLTELKQKAGTPLNAGDVRQDMRKLFATGRYRDLNVYAQPVADGKIVLVYSGTARYFVGRVKILGVKNDRLASLLESATKLQPGFPYLDTDLSAAVEGIRQTLEQNGFRQPVIKAEKTTEDVGSQVNAIFFVTVGPPAKIGDVAVEGKDPGIDVTTFRKKGSLNCSRLALIFNKKCQAKVNRNTVDTALTGVREYYQKGERLEGTISLQDSSYQTQRRQVDYKFAANQGPVVSIKIDGTKVSKSRMKLLVPVFQEGAVDNDLLNEGAFNIREFLQRKGYFDATVDVSLSDDKDKAGHVQITYTVVTGREHRVTDVKISGNKYFDHDTIEELMRTKKSDLYQRSGQYSSQLVASDVSSIQALYRANGFLDVKVTSAVKDIDKGRDGKDLKQAQLDVSFTIVEGTQDKFGAVALNGVDGSRLEKVKSLLSSQTGQPFSFLTLSGDRDAVFSYYLSQGFDHARVNIAQETQKTTGGQINVSLNVDEGQSVTIDQVLLSGDLRTKPPLVNKQLEVHAGEPLNQAALLETQRNLYNLALFNEVNVAVQDPDGVAPYKNVLVQLDEAKRWDVTYGFGFEAQSGTPGVVPGERRGTTAAQNGKAGASPRVSLDVSRINLRGSQDSITLHTSYGLLEELALLSYNSPTLFNKKQLTGTLTGGYSNVQDVTTFASKTLQGDFRVSQKYKRTDTFIYDFQYRRVSIDQDSLEINPTLINQLAAGVIVGGPSFTYIHDTRDPSPLNAGKGQYFTVTEFFASSKFGSGTDFNKLDGSHSSYYTFGKHKYVFARNTRLGFERTWGGNPNAVDAGNQLGVSTTACAGALLQTNPTCNAVPLPERLYAGGATSHRGFGINDAGPRDLTTGYPVGGNGVVVNTFELRLPPPTLPLVGNSVSFVIFHDMGNTFQNPGDMFKSIKNFRQPGEQACRNLTIPGVAPGTNPTPAQQQNAVGTCNFNYFSHAVGLGLRYNTPVGPLRVDFSYNLNPPIYPVFDDYTGKLPYVGQASHFNFFFSIGQSF